MYPQQIAINEKNIEKLTSFFKSAYKDIVGEINSATNFGIANRKAILRQIDSILEGLGVDVNAFIQKELPNYYKDGANDAVDQLNHVGADVKVSEGFNRVHKDAIAALIDDTQTAFGESISGVRRSASLLLNKAVRDNLSQQIALGVTKGDALKQVKNTVTGLLQNEGLDALVDKSGRGWSLDNYAEMLIRTKIVEARNRGLINRMTENDYDLVEVSSHGADDVCGDWEGKILSMTGQTPGYPTVAEAEADGLFHPNCKHAINALVPSLSKLTNAYDPEEDTLTPDEVEQKTGKDIASPPPKGDTFTVYRGTGKPTPMGDLNAYGDGTYYSFDKQFASIFGDVKQSTLTLEKPLIIKSQDDLDKYSRAMVSNNFESLSDWAKSQGYDGIIDKQTETLLKFR